MITVLSDEFSLVHSFVNQLRSVEIQNDRMKFRRNLERIGEIAAYEISKKLPSVPVEIRTPLAMYQGKELEKQPVLVTILRAGIPLFEGILNYFDQADCGFVAAYRKHDSNDYFTIQQDYLTCPEIENRPLIVADPMLATGASLVEALKDLLKIGKPSELHIVAAIGSEQGVKAVAEAFSEAHIWIGAVDEALTEKGYISPGLGDAGDLSFGKKLQF